MLDKYKVKQIQALLSEGHGIKTVARLTGVSRNTVRRYQRNTPRKGHHGPAWRAMEAKREEVKKLFYDCKGNCSAMHRFVKDTIGVEAPSLRTLQKFCKPFRLELRQSRLTKTGRFETPPGHQMQIDFGEDDVCVGGEGLVHCHASSSSMSRGASCTTKPPRRRDEWLRVADSLETCKIPLKNHKAYPPVLCPNTQLFRCLDLLVFRHLLHKNAAPVLPNASNEVVGGPTI